MGVVHSAWDRHCRARQWSRRAPRRETAATDKRPGRLVAGPRTLRFRLEADCTGRSIGTVWPPSLIRTCECVRIGACWAPSATAVRPGQVGPRATRVPRPSPRFASANPARQQVYGPEFRRAVRRRRRLGRPTAPETTQCSTVSTPPANIHQGCALPRSFRGWPPCSWQPYRRPPRS